MRNKKLEEDENARKLVLIWRSDVTTRFVFLNYLTHRLDKKIPAFCYWHMAVYFFQNITNYRIGDYLRDVPRLADARGKKQVWRPHVRT